MERIVLLFVLFATLATGQGYIGRLDTIGGTTCDLQWRGPALRRVLVEPGTGVTVAWSYSAAHDTSFPDLAVRHNFYDLAGRAWNAIVPDFMQSGTSIAGGRLRLGNLAWSGSQALVAGDFTESGHARPAAVRLSGERCSGPAGRENPLIAAGPSGRIHVAFTDSDTAPRLYYARIDPWCTWSAPLLVTIPRRPSHAVAASPVSDRVCLAWTRVEGTERRPAFYIESTDGGASWGGLVQLPLPDAFRGDTGASFTGQGVFPWYDALDRLHVAATIVPLIRDSVRVSPAAIWHWCRESDTGWSEVRKSGCDPGRLAGPLGPGAAYVGMPNIGSDRAGALYVAWEEFDSTNVGPSPPGYLRAGIWLARSANGGNTWQPGLRLTPANDASHRFPSIGERGWPGFSGDTLVVTCELDRHPGFFALGEGEATDNPVVCQFISTQQVPGVTEEHTVVPPVRLSCRLAAGRLELAGADRAVLYDALGRKRRQLTAGANPASGLEPGSYFCRAGREVVKLVVP